MHRFEWDHGLPLNDANFDLKVNMLRYEEIDAKGGMQRFPWVTDLPARTGHGDVRHAVRPPQVGHRERDVPDTEARDPYRFEHSFGHGQSHLADVFATLAMLAFLIDQVQQHCCPLFGRARRHQGRNLYLWNRLREPVRTFAFPDWRTPCRAIAGQLGREDYVGLIRAGA